MSPFGPQLNGTKPNNDTMTNNEFVEHDNMARGGGSLHSQVEHHARDKFATPILHGIDNF